MVQYKKGGWKISSDDEKKWHIASCVDVMEASLLLLFLCFSLRVHPQLPRKGWAMCGVWWQGHRLPLPLHYLRGLQGTHTQPEGFRHTLMRSHALKQSFLSKWAHTSSHVQSQCVQPQKDHTYRRVCITCQSALVSFVFLIPFLLFKFVHQWHRVYVHCRVCD